MAARKEYWVKSCISVSHKRPWRPSSGKRRTLYPGEKLPDDFPDEYLEKMLAQTDCPLSETPVKAEKKSEPPIVPESKKGTVVRRVGHPGDKGVGNAKSN